VIEGSAAVLATMGSSDDDVFRVDAIAFRLESMAASEYRVDDVMGSATLASYMETMTE